MTILVDPRIGSGDLAAIMRRYITPSSTVVTTELDAADVVFQGNGVGVEPVSIGIEVKRVSDALQCMQDGRFSGDGGQLERMCRDYDFCWLVVEDKLVPDPQSGLLMRWKDSVAISRPSAATRKRRPSRLAAPRGRWVPALFGAKRTLKYVDFMKWLTSLQVQTWYRYHKPLLVWSTATRDETAQWCVAQYHAFNDKRFDQHKSMRMFNSSAWDKTRTTPPRSVGFMSPGRRRRAQILNAYDGIGYERAMNVALSFSSDDAMYQASVEQFERIKGSKTTSGNGKTNKDGLGKVLARRLYEQMHEIDKGVKEKK